MTTELHEMTSEPPMREGFTASSPHPRLTYRRRHAAALLGRAGALPVRQRHRTKLTPHSTIPSRSTERHSGAPTAAKQDWLCPRAHQPQREPEHRRRGTVFIASRLGHDLARTTYDVDRPTAAQDAKQSNAARPRRRLRGTRTTSPLTPPRGRCERGAMMNENTPRPDADEPDDHDDEAPGR